MDDQQDATLPQYRYLLKHDDPYISALDAVTRPSYIPNKVNDLKRALNQCRDAPSLTPTLVEQVLSKMKDITTGQLSAFKDTQYMARLSKWISVDELKPLRNLVEFRREYFRLFDFATLQFVGNLEMYMTVKLKTLPEARPEVWQFITRYCEETIPLVPPDDLNFALHVVCVLQWVIDIRDVRDDTTGDQLRRDLIALVDRIIPVDSKKLLSKQHVTFIYWAKHLMDKACAKHEELWQGDESMENLLSQCTAGGDQIFKTWKELYIRLIVSVKPVRPLERYYVDIYAPVRADDVITAVFNVVVACYYFDGTNVDYALRSLAEFPDKDPLIDVALSGLDMPIIDDKIALTVIRAIEVEVTKNKYGGRVPVDVDNLQKTCKLLSQRMVDFLESQASLATLAEVCYALADLYDKILTFYHDHYDYFFANADIKHRLSYNVLNYHLDDCMIAINRIQNVSFMEISPEDNRMLKSIVRCMHAFEQHSQLLDLRLFQYVVDFADPETTTFASYHSGGYVQNASNFEALAVNIREKVEECRQLLHNNLQLCRRMEKISAATPDKGWFLVTTALLDTGLYWLVIEKSRSLDEPCEIDNEFKRGYTLEYVDITLRACTRMVEVAPQFNALYVPWFLIMENVDADVSIDLTQKRQLYHRLINAALTPNDFDCGYAADAPLLLLLVTECADRDHYLDLIVQNEGNITAAIFDRINRTELEDVSSLRRTILGMERLLNMLIIRGIHLTDDPHLPILPGWEEYPLLLKSLQVKWRIVCSA